MRDGAVQRNGQNLRKGLSLSRMNDEWKKDIGEEELNMPIIGAVHGVARASSKPRFQRL